MTRDQQIHDVDQPTHFCDALTFDRGLNESQKNNLFISDADPRQNMAGAILVAFAVAIAVGFTLLFSGGDHTSSKTEPAPSEKLHFARAADEALQQRAAPAPQPEISSEQSQPGASSSPGVRREARSAPSTAAEQSPDVAPKAPTAAPLLVAMKIARDSANSPHVEAVRRALAVLGASSATLEIVDKRVARPRVGYYFRSDRSAAMNVARALAPILGEVDLLSIALGAPTPSPGSIEVRFQ